ncbi:MAG: hypothetical protein ACEQSB_05760 [Undibacterium sp.]
MKCPLCNDTGLLLAFTDQGVAPRCSCPAKTAGQIGTAMNLRPLQEQAELTHDDEFVALQAE